MAGSKEIRALNMSRVERTHPINEAYHQEVSELIRTVTGAREVLPQPSGLIVRTTDRALPSYPAHATLSSSATSDANLDSLPKIADRNTNFGTRLQIGFHSGEPISRIFRG